MRKGILLLISLFLAITPTASWGATITVDAGATDEQTDTDAKCSLREAIDSVNGAGDSGACVAVGGYGAGDTINIPADTITITGASGEDANASGDFDITKAVIITGAGAGSTIIDGGAIDGVFDVTAAVDVTFDGVTITGGNAAGAGGGILARGAVTLINSTVSGNTAAGWYGGVYAGGALIMTNSTVSGNTATTGSGGGIYGRTTVTLDNSTVSNNTATTGNYGGIFAEGAVTLTNSTVSGNTAGASYGGIYGDTTVTLTDSTVSGNTAGDWHGGIYALGAVTLTDSTVSGNTARWYGGIYGVTTVTMTNSTVSGNKATTGSGGGIYALGAVTLTDSTISGNTAGVDYGGIYADGALTLTNSTVSGNTAGSNVGGIYGNTTVTLDNSTVSNNTATTGNYGGICGNTTVTLTNSTVSGNTAGSNVGGIYADTGGLTATNATIYGNSAGGTAGGVFTLGGSAISNTIIANNTGGPDCAGVPPTSSGYNIDSDGTCNFIHANDLASGDPLVGALANNGGTTMTHALTSLSPAIDTGSCVNGTDQIGTARPQGAGCDIGALEMFSGCTDAAATNYNASANLDDGSCTYAAVAAGGGGSSNSSPYDPNGGGAEWLLYPNAGETGVNTGTVFTWYTLTDDDGDTITYDPQFCDGFESGDCTSWSSVTSRTAMLSNPDNKLVATGAVIFAIGFIGAIRTRRGRTLMLALILMTSGALLSACSDDSSDDTSTTSSGALTCDDVADGVECQTQSGLDANTEYTWRVVASDGNGGENISVSRTFTTGSD